MKCKTVFLWQKFLEPPAENGTHLDHDLLCLVFHAHVANGGRRRTHEDYFLGGTKLGEVRILAEEAVARVDGIGAQPLCHIHNFLATQITLQRARFANPVGGVCEFGVQGIDVGIRIDSDCLCMFVRSLI